MKTKEIIIDGKKLNQMKINEAAIDKLTPSETNLIIHGIASKLCSSMSNEEKVKTIGNVFYNNKLIGE